MIARQFRNPLGALLRSSWSSSRSLANAVCNEQATGSWDHDVLICGGGVVGAALAADLLQRTSSDSSGSSLNIGIIDRQPPSSLMEAEAPPDVRVYAMSPASIKFLKRIGAWNLIEERSQPYTNMQVWEATGPGMFRFSAADMDVPELGRICEDRTIQAAIFAVMRERGHTVTEYFGCSVDSFHIDDTRLEESGAVGAAEVTIVPSASNAEKTTLRTRLLVGADGAQSAVRRLAGVPTWGWGYGQEAVVATVKLPGAGELESGVAAAANTTAWQKYLSTGPLALLPLWDNYCSIVWSVPVSEAQRLKALSPEAFIDELNKALSTPPVTDKWSILEPSDGTTLPPFLHRFTKIGSKVKREVAAMADMALAAAQMSDPLRYPPHVDSLHSSRVSFPLAFQQTRHYVADRLALIGDAAHTIHPQAGQGLNLGLLDVVSLSDHIIAAVGVGQDLGDKKQVLQPYHRDRYAKNLAMLSIVDIINTIFSDSTVIGPRAMASESGRVADTPATLAPLEKGKQLARSLGMLGVHQLGPLKQRIARFAMGMDSAATSSTSSSSSCQ